LPIASSVRFAILCLFQGSLDNAIELVPYFAEDLRSVIIKLENPLRDREVQSGEDKQHFPLGHSHFNMLGM
jgi:hypothetical protein